MGKPDIDFRLVVTQEIDDALSAYARGFKLDRQAVARMVLTDWARQFKHAATVLRSLNRTNGSVTESTRQKAAQSEVDDKDADS